MKILLINTGGTIACRATSMGLQPQLTAEELLEFLPKTTSICQIDALNLMSLESSDIAPRHWLNMVLAVESQYEAYDGFILCHGSDTMAYTAAALSYLIADSLNPSFLPERSVLWSNRDPTVEKTFGMPSPTAPIPKPVGYGWYSAGKSSPVPGQKNYIPTATKLFVPLIFL